MISMKHYGELVTAERGDIKKETNIKYLQILMERERIIKLNNKIEKVIIIIIIIFISLFNVISRWPEQYIENILASQYQCVHYSHHKVK